MTKRPTSSRSGGKDTFGAFKRNERIANGGTFIYYEADVCSKPRQFSAFCPVLSWLKTMGSHKYTAGPETGIFFINYILYLTVKYALLCSLPNG